MRRAPRKLSPDKKKKLELRLLELAEEAEAELRERLVCEAIAENIMPIEDLIEEIGKISDVKTAFSAKVFLRNLARNDKEKADLHPEWYAAMQRHEEIERECAACRNKELSSLPGKKNRPKRSGARKRRHLALKLKSLAPEQRDAHNMLRKEQKPVKHFIDPDAWLENEEEILSFKEDVRKKKAEKSEERRKTFAKGTLVEIYKTPWWAGRSDSVKVASGPGDLSRGLVGVVTSDGPYERNRYKSTFKTVGRGKNKRQVEDRKIVGSYWALRVFIPASMTEGEVELKDVVLSSEGV